MLFSRNHSFAGAETGQLTGRSKICQNVALALGAIITVLNAVEAFYDHRSLWIRRTATLARLYSVQADLNYLVAGSQDSEMDRESLDKLMDRYKTILQDDLTAWLKLRSSSLSERPSAKTSTTRATGESSHSHLKQSPYEATARCTAKGFIRGFNHTGFLGRLREARCAVPLLSPVSWQTVA